MKVSLIFFFLLCGCTAKLFKSLEEEGPQTTLREGEDLADQDFFKEEGRDQEQRLPREGEDFFLPVWPLPSSLEFNRESQGCRVSPSSFEIFLKGNSSQSQILQRAVQRYLGLLFPSPLLPGSDGLFFFLWSFFPCCLFLSRSFLPSYKLLKIFLTNSSFFEKEESCLTSLHLEVDSASEELFLGVDESYSLSIPESGCWPLLPYFLSLLARNPFHLESTFSLSFFPSYCSRHSLRTNRFRSIKVTVAFFFFLRKLESLMHLKKK